MALLLRVNINPKLIRKVQLTKRPECVEQLLHELREKLELEGDFSVQYEDPDFENALCNLTDMLELPAEKAVLHIVWNNEDESQTPSQVSISSLDTASISCHEVSVNWKRGRSEDPDEGGFSLKKPKRGEVNHLPDHPENFDDDTLEDERCVLVDETKKKYKDMELISQKMELTFSLRRKEIIEVQPMVTEIQERWPALFLKEQICSEFYRVTTKDLLGTFRAALDTYCPRLLKLYRARKGALGRDMESLLDALDEQTSDITKHRRRACLEGLPHFLRDTSEKLFLKCLDTDPEDGQTKGVQMGVLTVFMDDGAPTSLQTVNNIAVVLEETVVLQDIPDIPTAFAYLFGLLYALNMEFPRHLRYTFKTVQHIFMELTPSCSQRVRSLKTKLLQ